MKKTHKPVYHTHTHTHTHWNVAGPEGYEAQCSRAHPTFSSLCSPTLCLFLDRLIPPLLQRFPPAPSQDAPLLPLLPCLSLQKYFHPILHFYVFSVPFFIRLLRRLFSLCRGFVLDELLPHTVCTLPSEASSSSPLENREIQYELLSLLQGRGEGEEKREREGETERDK